MCVHVCNVFPLYGCLLPTFYLLYSGVLEFLPPSPPPAPPLPPSGCFTIAVISFSFWIINCCINFSWRKLFLQFVHSSVEWSHRWLPQYLILAIFHLLHFHIPTDLLPASNASYDHHNPCLSVPLPSTTFDLFQVGHANLPRPAPSFRFPWTCRGIGARF